ncbi:MAG TPA: hypothetical protein GXX33_05455 [Firmicutes bacterium]|uniref:SIS domain-containing protein n=1 Tax=Capillibacterium thermochitinicola TaxID=2699427 RepID=A0A8J6I1M0_9FIRM|nr:hypothetical protein [Capillibacterium thermochitinicola]MBA2134025.1 hypothetical protein [Capillibacterium thermochitinicola]HHW12431.1 hypothetical protein [Bacillota bacterium]
MLNHNFNREFILSQLLDLAELPVLLSTEGLDVARQMASKMVDIFQAQKSILIIGLEPYHNIARDLAEHLKHGLNMDRPPLPVSFLEKTSRQQQPLSNLISQGEKGDALFIIAGEHSQETETLVREAKEKNLFTFAFCSYPPLKNHRPDLLFYLPSANRPRVKEIFLMLGHIIGTLVESTLFGNSF